jgi:hypothetical protein
MELILFDFTEVHFELDKKQMVGCTLDELVRYFKGVYSNKERFLSRFLNEKRKLVEGIKDIDRADEPDADRFYENAVYVMDFLEENFDNATPFSFKEAFEIKGREFQAMVFASINITEMIHSLGAKRIKTDGIEVKHRKYSESGEFLGLEDYHNVYETHEINGEKLGINGSLYVVKCWCTSTNKEHWLWIDEQYKDDPLNAIASTFVVHKNLLPHVTAIKRQGDLLLLELDSDVKPEGETVHLTKDEYFKLLVAQS